MKVIKKILYFAAKVMICIPFVAVLPLYVVACMIVDPLDPDYYWG